MSSEKEPRGYKDHVKIQCQKFSYMKFHSYIQWNRYLRPHVDRITKKFTKVIRVHTNYLGTKDDLANTIRKNFGLGTFNVLFYSRYQKNKKFNPNFNCKICRIKPRYKKGMSCKHNRRYRPNWSPRATIEIKQIKTRKGDDFKYKFLMNKMYYFWFWYDD